MGIVGYRWGKWSENKDECNKSNENQRSTENSNIKGKQPLQTNEPWNLAKSKAVLMRCMQIFNNAFGASNTQWCCQP